MQIRLKPENEEKLLLHAMSRLNVLLVAELRGTQ